MSWYVVILFFLFILIGFDYLGHTRRINMDNLIILVCAMVLFFFMGCRSVTVGADTIQYVHGFRQICNTDFLDLFTINVYGFGWGYELHFEYGYRVFNKLVSYISQSEQAILFSTSLLIIVLLIVLIKNQSIYPYLSIWLYVTLGIFQTQMNMIRNAIAILICYLGFHYLKERKLLKYLLCVLIGMIFHVSAIVFIPLYWVVNCVKLTPKIVWSILIIAVLFGFGFAIIRSYIITVLPFGFGSYFQEETTRFEGLAVGVFHFLILLFTWFTMDCSEKTKIVKDEIIGIWTFVAEIFFFCVGYEVAAATRMAALFGPYLLILIPNLIGKGIKNASKRSIVIAMLMLFTGLQYILRLTINNIGATMPYQFFWY